MTKINIFKIAFYLFILMLISYFCFNAIRSLFFNDNFVLKTVEESTYNDFIEISGIAVRTETLVNTNAKYNFINYSVNDGERISKNSVIAHYNTSSLNTQDKLEIEKLNRKIYQLENSIEDKIQYDVTTLEKQIKHKINSFLFESEKEDFNKVIEKIDEIQVLYNKKDMKVSGSKYYTNILSDINLAKEKILKENNTSEEYVRSPIAGYFLSGYDGYEFLNAIDYSEVTVSDYYDLSAKTALPLQSYYIGKLQSVPYWNFICIMNTNDVKNLYIGKKVDIEFDLPYAGTKSLSVYVEYISRNQEDKTAVNFRCETLNSDIFKLRKETAKLILTSYSGLKVDNDALRVNEGKDGVFVLSAKKIIFKPIDIIYSSSEFSIVRPAVRSGSRMLVAKDTVLLGGKDVFDGKIVNIG